MRTFLSLTLGTIFFCSCSNNGDDVPPIPMDNKAPLSVTQLTFPTDNMLCSDNELDFQWEKALDPNNDTLTYILEVATDDKFTNTEVFETASNIKTVTLAKNQIYYWRVAAKDPFNLIGPYTNVSKFYTEGGGETNHLPFLPDLVVPENNQSVDAGMVKLVWASRDVDGDQLAFDVYLDTKNPPETKIESNKSTFSIGVSVQPNTTYFWRIVVNDGNGGEAIGRVWSFTTN
ncbi:hypothetical protein [Zobellia uliginosa]|uniref:hypothetical protein n=1 Tax=Zobellia uliginosa TaxID=143224 RepID=UPI0026E447C0|nr:hypothetical protein [Zobellia uliginosa]MDO6519008.1 hypothetical protein [Zobellia uliginosa]